MPIDTWQIKLINELLIKHKCSWLVLVNTLNNCFNINEDFSLVTADMLEFIDEELDLMRGNKQ